MLVKWILALHIISVICWYAGLFYLPRLFVYHAMTQDKAVASQLCVMEHKLYRYIMWPSLIATVISGYALMFQVFPHAHYPSWLHAKLLCVGVLVLFHLMCGVLGKRLREGRNTYSHRFYRFFNEVPTLLLFAIVLLVVLKP